MEREREIGEAGEMTKCIRESAEKILKKSYRRKVGKAEGERRVERKWMNEEIRGEIKKRREINRRKRNCEDLRERMRLEKEYRIQKWRVQDLVREAVG